MEQAIFNCLLSLFAGVGVFIAGMNLMGDGLEKSAGEGMKRIFRKVGNSPFINVGAGALVTGIIQSSAATIGIVQALALAGGITWEMAIPLVLGANIGTCVTVWYRENV